MPIPVFLLDRIKTSAMSGQQVADAFARLAEVADKAGIDGCAVNLEYTRDEDQLLAGDLIPTITFSLKRRQRCAEPVTYSTSLVSRATAGSAAPGTRLS